MRILAIRGENLASLAGKFEVDFQQAPLAGAGVFAISGPTGAGKSTLLDALCLALYHDTPRLLAARENGVTIPDVGDRTLSPQDPRNLLRRGCAEGYAEVDFMGSDGFPRRARWQVRRARGKKDGALQAPSVSLLRIDTDATETTSLGETSKAIESYVGLTFGQFRRAVLLAQNDFAALLKAGQNERADLLEALTNTRDFSLLSAAAYQRNAHEQKQLDELRQQLNVLSVLSEEDRTTLDNDVASSQAQCHQLNGVLETLRKEAQWHERGQRLLQDQAAAAQSRDQLHQALDADRPQQLQLQQWNAIAPLRAQWNNRSDTATRINSIHTALPGLAEAIEQAGKQQAEVAELFQQASHTLAQAQTQRQHAEPLLAEARKADAVIRQRSDLLAGHTQQLQASVREHNEVTAAHQRGADEQQRLQAIVDTWSAWRQMHPALDHEDAGWNLLGETLRHAEKQRAQLERTHEQAAALKDRQAAAQVELDQAGEKLTQVHTALLDGQALAESCELAWQALDSTALATAKDAHQTRSRRIDELAAALNGWTAIEMQQHETGDKVSTLQQHLIDQRKAVETAEAAGNNADRTASAARAAFDRANLAADKITQRLREALQPGEPCLVCGATEHPQAHTESAALDQLLATLKQQQQAADKARDLAHQRHERAKVELETSEKALAETMTTLQNIVTRLDSARASCAAITARIDAHLAEAAGQGPAALVATLSDASKARDEHTATLDYHQAQLTSATKARESANQSAAVLRKRFDEARQQQEAVRDQLAPLDAQQHATQLLAEQTEQTLQHAITDLRTQCRDPQMEGEHISRLLSDWNEGEGIRSAAALTREPLATCSATIQAQSSRLSVLQTTNEQLTQTCESDRAALTQAQTQRQQVLAQPDADTYARLLEKTESDSRNAQEAQRERLAEATRAHALANSNRQQADTDLQQLQEQLARYEQQLLEQLQPHATILQLAAPGLTDLARLITSLPTDLIARTAAWDAREKIANEADARCRALLGQQEEWQREAGSQREAAATNDELALAVTAYDDALARRAKVQALQQEDTRRHAQAAEHREQIETLARQARRWQQLNDLIGSANGSKFKTYAQQFTLEVLLDYANQHLARLSPRYRLRRGNEPLSLLMIDADFADEVRSVHSLSGGESFLVSLALALGLASLSSERVRVESLIIDEGFGSLDADTLNMAMEALDRLQSEGRRVGVISHVHDMAERIGVQIRAKQVAPGKSVVTVGG